MQFAYRVAEDLVDPHQPEKMCRPCHGQLREHDHVRLVVVLSAIETGRPALHFLETAHRDHFSFGPALRQAPQRRHGWSSLLFLAQCFASLIAVIQDLFVQAVVVASQRERLRIHLEQGRPGLDLHMRPKRPICLRRWALLASVMTCTSTHCSLP